ncbi:Mth938-like domain-containing protein [Lichenihabitans sp. Uapishka_5]|uniref:Mth938-like domain-containing protein n=1 Tax=Lichenihabitans sp. Uapishka_5 TaxID=3037302 RepID=UPI0029E7DB99|nr:Mth938-like domain-containing protein [Lichenihabitans sp. Uapishka_5]MDX7953264.1 Mth938-like domain-containing protein [Lichenihabitans sp. Uapishka_5]
MADSSGFVPGQHGIDAYGSGGFKFAGMSHRGSILALPTGVHAFAATCFAEITAETLAPLLALPRGAVDLLLVGTGPDLVPLAEPLRAQLRAAGIRSDPMATGAAARTYNVLLGEGRRVAAALVAVG